MSERKDPPTDHYEVLQISPNADPEMIARVYRLLAQRFHPDNQETGNPDRFRVIHDAYTILSDPEKRAGYDVTHQQQRQDRWRLIASAGRAENDFEAEQILRLTVLEVLYTRRRMEPMNPGVFPVELEGLTGRPREHLEFTIWFLLQKHLLQRSENSRLVISAEGAEYLEQNYKLNIQKRLQLQAQPETP